MARAGTSDQVVRHPWEDRVIDERYRIVRPLGSGSMGAVFVAEHLKLQKLVALKVVHSELSHHRELLVRFAREAMAGSRIDHPSVVESLDYGSLEEGGAYLVMPLVQGENLSVLMERRGAMPWREVVELGAQIADALAAAWAAGFVHRDLKPDNILIEPRAAGPALPRVIDFGVAKLFERLSEVGGDAPGGAQPLTKEGTVIGTPGYMAPEQALGRAATHTADLYSLGVILWEAIAGAPLWIGETTQAVLRAQLTQPTPRLNARHPGSAPEELDELLQRMISQKPEARPQSAAEVRDSLRRIASGAAPGRAEKPRRTHSRHVWAVLFSMLVAGALLGTFFATR